MTATMHQVRRDLVYLSDAWPSLVALKIPGTAHAWAERPQFSHTRPGPGDGGIARPAPADVNVLDLLHMFATRADDIARCVLDVAGLDDPRFLPDCSATADPRPWLLTAQTWVPAAQEIDDKTVPWIAYQIDPMVHHAARLLGDVRDGQVLHAVCPWCGGRGQSGVLGERTMEVHYPEFDDEDDEPLIVCRGVNCSPPENMCRLRWRGHPAWERGRWEWLSLFLRAPADLDTRGPERAPTRTP